MTTLTDYGFNPSLYNNIENAVVARVSAVHKERFELICQYGVCFGKLKSSVYYAKTTEPFPTVGDFVTIDYIDNGDSRITKTLNRKSFFSRLDPAPGGNIEQAIAANFDYVFIVASLNFDFNLRRIERYVTLAWQSGATPVILLTKADLLPDFFRTINASSGSGNRC